MAADRANNTMATPFRYGSILVEGQTEEAFVNDILNPHLNLLGLYLTPILAVTKRLSGGGVHKGGIVSYGKVRFQLEQLLKNANTVVITTMIDYYGLRGKDFPGYEDLHGRLKGRSPYEKVEHLEASLRADIDHPRFLPYFALHEFEAMLFAEVHCFPRIIVGLSDRVVERLHAVRQAFETPELINDLMPPSVRIHEILSESGIKYEKPQHGVDITADIGLDSIRQSCQHFDSWLKKLEQLAHT